MRGHIKKRIELRLTRRARRRRKLTKWAPKIKGVLKPRLFLKTLPHQSLYISRKVVRFDILSYLNKYNILYRFDIFKLWNLFSLKLLFDFNRYVLLRRYMTIKRTNFINWKWSSSLKDFLQGTTEHNFQTTLKFTGNLHHLFRYKIGLHLFCKTTFNYFRTCVKYNKLTSVRVGYIRIFNILYFLRLTKKCNKFIFINFFNILRSHFVKLGLILGGIRKKTNWRVSKRRQNHFTQRLLKYKLHGLHLFIQRWSIILEKQLYIKTQLKFNHTCEALTFAPTTALALNNYSFIRKILINKFFPYIAAHVRSVKTNFELMYPKSFTQVLHDYVFYDNALDTTIKPYLQKILADFDTVSKKETLHIRAKHDFDALSPTEVKYQHGVYLPIDGNLSFLEKFNLKSIVDLEIEVYILYELYKNINLVVFYKI